MIWLNRNRAGQADGQRRIPLASLGFWEYLRLFYGPTFTDFLRFSTLFYALFLVVVGRQCVGNQSCSGIEAVITSLTRKRVTTLERLS